MVRRSLSDILTAPRLHVLANGLGFGGIAFGVWVLLGLGIEGQGGTGGGDALAYWRAGRSILGGTALYGAEPGTTSAYLYSPLFAQLVAPLALLPAAAFVWAWRAIELVGLRVATGSWSRAGIAILVFPPVLIELAYANVNLLIAAVCALAMRGVVTGWPAPILVKVAGLPLLPLAFQSDRRTFVRAGLVALAIGVVSVALAPGPWVEFLRFLAAGREPTWWTNLGQGIPLLPRLLVAMAIGVAAVRWRRLLPVAVLVGLPIIWLSAISILVATVVPLPVRDERPR